MSISNNKYSLSNYLNKKLNLQHWRLQLEDIDYYKGASGFYSVKFIKDKKLCENPNITFLRLVKGKSHQRINVCEIVNIIAKNNDFRQGFVQNCLKEVHIEEKLVRLVWGD